MAHQVRYRIVLESWRFTSMSAFGRELTHLLEHSDYYIEARVRQIELERVTAELGMIRGMSRMKVTVIKQEEAA